MREPGRLSRTFQGPLDSCVQVSQVSLLIQPRYCAGGATSILDFAFICALGGPLVEKALFGFNFDLLVAASLAVFEAGCSVKDSGGCAVL